MYTVAKNAVDKGFQYAYVGRKQKKRNFRSLWIQRINAGARELGFSYAELIDAIKNSGLDINRKILADLAIKEPESFKALVEQVKNSASTK